MPRLPKSILPSPSVLNSLLRTLLAPQTRLAGMYVYIPGTLSIRLSVVLGNLRMQRLLGTMLKVGDHVVDVGANIGYNTLYAAHCVGASGRVLALEPAQDNLAILYANLFANPVQNINVLPYAAGSQREVKRFFLRGEASAVNSLYEDNFYHPITGSVEVLAAPLDDLVTHPPNLVKIDVEGGELEVLQGMTRLLRDPALRLIVEWHPTLQQAAGYAADALPRFLTTSGYTVYAVSHTTTVHLQPNNLPQITTQLLQKRHPVELVAYRD